MAESVGLVWGGSTRDARVYDGVGIEFGLRGARGMKDTARDVL